VEQIRHTLERLKVAVMKPDSPWDEAAFLQELAKAREKIDEYVKLLVNVKKEGSLLDDAELRAVALGQRRMIAYQVHLAAAVAGVRKSPLVQATLEDLLHFFRMLDDLLVEWKEGQVPSPEADLKPLGSSLERRLKAFREIHSEISFEETAAFFGLYHSLMQYVKLTQLVTGETSLVDPGELKRQERSVKGSEGAS
jgi:hypothetical protein